MQKKKIVTWLFAYLCVCALSLNSACGAGTGNSLDIGQSNDDSSSLGSPATSAEGGMEDLDSSIVEGNKVYERLSDGTINFGSYPQNEVTDEAVISVLNEKAGVLPTTDNFENWISYEYYIEGNNEKDFMWYQDVTHGEGKYRGVYFTEYRPYRCSYPTDQNQQEENGYQIDTIYWFEWERLNWDILEEKDGTIFLHCNSIIDSQEYHHDNSETANIINGERVYVNYYAESNIRRWLNETFYEMAFTAEEKGIIQTTFVDGSKKSTKEYQEDVQESDETDYYANRNTNDKIFLLSIEELTNPNYNFKNPTGEEVTVKKSTDYAKGQGAFVRVGRWNDNKIYDGNGNWWTRSPAYHSSNYVNLVSFEGDIVVQCVDYSFLGIVPALKITL